MEPSYRANAFGFQLNAKIAFGLGNAWQTGAENTGSATTEQIAVALDTVASGDDSVLVDQNGNQGLPRHRALNSIPVNRKRRSPMGTNAHEQWVGQQSGRSQNTGSLNHSSDRKATSGSIRVYGSCTSPGHLSVDGLCEDSATSSASINQDQTHRYTTSWRPSQPSTPTACSVHCACCFLQRARRGEEKEKFSEIIKPKEKTCVDVWREGCANGRHTKVLRSQGEERWSNVEARQGRGTTWRWKIRICGSWSSVSFTSSIKSRRKSKRNATVRTH